MAIQAQLYPNNLGFPLWGSQDGTADNGCGTLSGFSQSCFSPQHKHMHQQLYNQRQRNQSMFNDPTYVNGLPSIPNYQSLALQFEMQGQEIDLYIYLQSEKLRMKLQEQRKQQVATLLKKVESETVYLLMQKDEEIAEAVKKRVELEDFLSKLEAENQAWRRVAEENEAMVLTLHNTLEEMREKAYYGFNNGVVTEDAESCCDESRGSYREMEEEEKEEEEDNEDVAKKMMACKSCDSGKSSFLFLPCRHLCSCKNCEAFLEACPVCKTPKKASIEALIF